MKEIVRPLKSYGVSYFMYAKRYVDGSRVYLGTHPECLNSYLTEKHYLSWSTDAKPELYHEQAQLWATLPDQNQFQYLRESGISHGMFLILPNNGFCECFTFASNVENPRVMNYFLNNLEIFKQFSKYFKEQTKQLIDQTSKHKIILPYHQIPISPYKIKQDLISPQQNLTSREQDCIELLLTGLTAKEIGKKLEISYRTVELYMYVLRQKFSARNKAELILKIMAMMH